MDQILSHFNLKIDSTQTNTEKTKLNFRYIANPDGSIRWVFPAELKQPLFLKFYTVNTLRSKVFAASFKIAFALRLQRLVSKSIQLTVSKIDSEKDVIFDFSQKKWALFTGTIGPNNKFLIYSVNQSKTSFYKIATSKQSKQIIDNEFEQLNQLHKQNFQSFSIPKILSHNENSLELEDISEGERYTVFEKSHTEALGELYEKYPSNRIDWSTYNALFSIEETFEKLILNNDERIPKGMLKKLNEAILLLQANPIETAFSHGDFTPWNMYKIHGKPAIYDWELASEQKPIGFDAFHFIIQKGILIDRSSWKQIDKEIHSSITDETLKKWSKHNQSNLSDYLLLYLVTNTLHYLDIYSYQPVWHEQINWLLNTWNEGLSKHLQKERSTRQLFIYDFFDFLLPIDYAALKFPNTSPDLLSNYSDIDICLSLPDAQKTVDYIQKNAFVNNVNIVEKSFMKALSIELINGEIIAIDLIWKLKRKAIVFQNATDIIHSSKQNEFGVKIPSNEALTHYIIGFYGLNKAEIPEKYNSIISETIEPIKFKKIFEESKSLSERKQKILEEVNSFNENKGFQKFKNNYTYLLDTMKTTMGKRGIIITFSGVDGAGKSTIIENVKHEIEKKLRKKVVVIRHRPSLLPILSAITKGKEQAEKDAANRLPRQGNNKSSLSSILRFLYYYFDYFVGQFYVNFKYKYRGTIILYDRYYYDFINDAKRSNIDISEGIVKFGYNFVFTPDLNFFLYADPEIILKRKQELSAETIVELTNKYSKLFTQYESRKKKQNYHLINNIDLNTTIDFIMKNIQTKLK